MFHVGGREDALLKSLCSAFDIAKLICQGSDAEADDIWFTKIGDDSIALDEVLGDLPTVWVGDR